MSRRRSPRNSVSEPQARVYYFELLPTLKSLGRPFFRSRQAHDVACMAMSF